MIGRHRGGAGADQSRHVELGGLAAQVPERVVDAGDADHRDTAAAQKADVAERARRKTAAELRVEPEHQRFEASHHLIDDGEALVVEREHQSFADETGIGLEKYQHAVGGAQLQGTAVDRRIERKMHDPGAQFCNLHVVFLSLIRDGFRRSSTHPTVAPNL